MATHSSILAWRIPGTEEPGGLPSMGLHRGRHDRSDLAAAAAAAKVCFKATMRKFWLWEWREQPNKFPMTSCHSLDPHKD